LDLDDRETPGRRNSPGKRRSPSSQSTSQRDGNGALLDAAMALVEIDIGRVATGVFEEALNLSTQCRLVGLDGEKIAGASVLDCGRDHSVGGDGVDGDQRALEALALGEALAALIVAIPASAVPGLDRGRSCRVWKTGCVEDGLCGSRVPGGPALARE
jgi:hypothetical protein